MKNKADIVREFIKQFPTMPKIRLARLISSKHPKMFQGNIENIRKEIQRQTRTSVPQPKVTEPITHVKVTTAGYCGIISDLHIPYHDSKAVETALADFKKHKISTLILLGDIVDFYSISRWEKDPDQRDLVFEVQSLISFLQHLRKEFPKTRILYKLGNHEMRWSKYLTAHAPELLGFEFLKFENLINSKELGIEIVDNKGLIHIGKLLAIHGHEYVFSISNPVNPARGILLRSKTTTIVGHFHRTSQHSERGLKNTITCWSLGCLCNLNPDYAPFNQWNQGYALVKLSNNLNFQIINKQLNENGGQFE